MSDENTTTTGPVVSATLNVSKAVLNKAQSALTSAVKAARKANAAIGAEIIALRCMFIRADGMPDMDGRSNEYRDAYGAALDKVGFDSKRERDSFVAAVAYHVNKGTEAWYTEHGQPIVVVRDKADDKRLKAVLNVDEIPDGDITLTPAQQVAYRGRTVEQQDDARKARADARSSATDAVGKSIGDDVATALAGRVSAIIGERGQNMDEARTFAKSAIAATLNTLPMLDRFETLLAAVAEQVENLSTLDSIPTPDRFRAILANLTAQVAAAVESLDKATTTTEPVAAENVA